MESTGHGRSVTSPLFLPFMLRGLFSNELVCNFIAPFLTPIFSGFASFALEFKNGFISPRAFYCWRRNVVVPSSLIYQMFTVTLSLLLRSELLLMCVPAGKTF